MKYLLLFENFICESLKEAPLQWSKDFEKILAEMEHPLAYELFQKRLIPETITLLNTSIDGEHISYLPSDKVIKRLNAEDYEQLKGLIRIQVWGESPIYNEGNVLTRTGRVFKKLLPNATSKEIEDLTNEYKSKFSKRNWKFLEGYEIKDGYKSGSYFHDGPRSNSLMNSCMNDELSLVSYYEYLPVRLLVLENEEGHILGRALVWKIDGGYLMDRVYTIYDKDYYLFTNYAKNEGWWWKSENKSSSDIPYTNGKETKWFPITINAPIEEYKDEYDSYHGFPYMDTFWFGYPDNKISNQPPPDGGYLKLTDVEGFPEYINEVLRDVNGELIENPEDYVYSNTQGGLVHVTFATWVKYEGFPGDYIEIDFLKKRVNGFVKDEEGNWFHIKDCKFLEDGSIVYPEK
jgi:hypothetical protein